MYIAEPYCLGTACRLQKQAQNCMYIVAEESHSAFSLLSECVDKVSESNVCPYACSSVNSSENDRVQVQESSNLSQEFGC